MIKINLKTKVTLKQRILNTVTSDKAYLTTVWVGAFVSALSQLLFDQCEVSYG